MPPSFNWVGQYGSIAQLEEHWDSTPAVVGSNPTGVTNLNFYIFIINHEK